MNIQMLDLLFLLGITLILFPIYVFNWMIGCAITGVVIVALSLQAAARIAGKDPNGRR